MKKEWELIKNIYGCTTILMQETEAKETENAFKVVEKSLKALEIIKEKNVDIEYIKIETITFKGYNSWIEFIDNIGINIPKNRNRQLTEEEFELLKEVLE